MAAAAIVDFVVVGKDGWLFAIYDEVRHTELPRIKTVTQIINDAAGILKKSGIDVVISLTPAKARVYRDKLPADFQFRPDSDGRYKYALDLLRASGALVPDLATAISDQRKLHPDIPVFLKADTHWTAAGAEAAAIELGKQIKAKIHLPPSSKPGTQLGGLIPARQNNNDLAEGLPDADGRTYGPESYMIHGVIEPASAGSLVEDDTADVLVVGNSFMQPKYGFAPMLSNQLGRPVSLVWKVHQSSPYRTLLGALGSEPFRHRKPKLLVWDFEETDMLAMPDQAGVWGPNVITAPAFLAALQEVVGG
jgi:alginate O-acetyltransferase complex protein AlgJ